jgi:pyruvate/2-oxoglutarate dehydrogenase complex dihydrolipoamide dehydrogenase (E3) component
LSLGCDDVRDQPVSRYDLVIVGMGSAGMTGAEFAITLGLRVAVVERGHVGGASLWTGSVPSKALVASARVAHRARRAAEFGVNVGAVEVDLPAVWARARAVQHDIARSDSNPHRYRDMGIEIVTGSATVSGPEQVTVTSQSGTTRTLDARTILLCTGSRPLIPNIDGLEAAGYLTTDTLFGLVDPPRTMAVIGGGPVGVELAQAFARLGIATTLIHDGPRLLPRDEPLLTDLLLTVLRAEGVDVLLNATIDSIEVDATGKVVRATAKGKAHAVRVDEIIVASGRTPNVDGLGLEALGVATADIGLIADSRGRTAIKSIYAAGDATGRYAYAHAAGVEAVRAIRDAFFPGRGSVDDLVPWCTFTEPELAHVGLTVAEAEERHGDDVDVWRIDLDHNDRARADGARTGAMTLITAKARLVGAHILAPHAGELIHELALAIRSDMKLEDIASLAHVYPTYATSLGQLAAESTLDRAHRLRWLVRKR